MFNVLRNFRVLVVINDESTRGHVTVDAIMVLCRQVDGCDFVHIKSLALAKELLRRELFHVVVVEDNLPDGSALELIAYVNKEQPEAIVIASSTDRNTRRLFGQRRCRTINTCEAMVAALCRVLIDVVPQPLGVK